MAVIFGSGAMQNRATAARVGPGPNTTQQTGVDNSIIANFRATVGAMQQVGSALRLPRP